MKLADVDRFAGHPLRDALQWLDTLLHSPAVEWNPQQRETAQATLAEARKLMGSDLVTLAAHRMREGGA